MVANELFPSALESRLVNKKIEMNRVVLRETMVHYWIQQAENSFDISGGGITEMHQLCSVTNM